MNNFTNMTNEYKNLPRRTQEYLGDIFEMSETYGDFKRRVEKFDLLSEEEIENIYSELVNQ